MLLVNSIDHCMDEVAVCLACKQCCRWVLCWF